MGTPAFLDLILPKLAMPLFTLAIDKWGTGAWDFGHINATKYTSTLFSAPVYDSCQVGGCWKVADIQANFPEGPMGLVNCAFFGESLLRRVIVAIKSPTINIKKHIKHLPYLFLLMCELIRSVIDTGFDLINMESQIVDRYYQDVFGASSSSVVPGEYWFPCDTNLPDLTLTIAGNGPVTIPGHVLNYHPSAGDPSGGCSRS